MPEAPQRVDPVTHRVPARTRGALAVGLVASIALGLLIAKPWDVRPVIPPVVTLLSDNPRLNLVLGSSIQADVRNLRPSAKLAIRSPVAH